MTQREILPTFRRFLHPVGDRRRKFGDQGQYERQICAFIDLLGVRQSNKSDPKVREALLDVFWSVSAVSAPFTSHPDDDVAEGGHWWGPEISAFSDCVVVSYPIERIEKLATRYDAPVVENIFSQLRYIIGTLAAACLTRGFLIRGAVTIGDLYHADGVILGPALDDAYELERKKAVYPRIVLSDAVQELLVSEYGRRPLVLGLNDLFHFDYLADMILESAPTEYMLPESSEGDDRDEETGEYADKMRAWLTVAIKIVNRNLSEQIEPSVRAKWIWFAQEFHETLAHRLRRGIVEDYGLTHFIGQFRIPAE